MRSHEEVPYRRLVGVPTLTLRKHQQGRGSPTRTSGMLYIRSHEEAPYRKLVGVPALTLRKHQQGRGGNIWDVLCMRSHEEVPYPEACWCPRPHPTQTPRAWGHQQKHLGRVVQEEP